MNFLPTDSCAWCIKSPVLKTYHDEEWGVEVHDPMVLFECLCLEGQQAGLSWLTVLKKRETYRSRFHGFDPSKIASMTDSEIDAALLDPGVIRLRSKLEAIRTNAIAYLAFVSGGGDFSKMLWSFVNDRPIVSVPNDMSEFKARIPESDAMSKALAKLGFKFVWSTICYAFMQAVWMAVDHDSGCRFKGASRHR